MHDLAHKNRALGNLNSRPRGIIVNEQPFELTLAGHSDIVS